jgi:hypothetical protein
MKMHLPNDENNDQRHLLTFRDRLTNLLQTASISRLVGLPILIGWIILFLWMILGAIAFPKGIPTNLTSIVGVIVSIVWSLSGVVQILRKESPLFGKAAHGRIAIISGVLTMFLFVGLAYLLGNALLHDVYR